MMLDFLVRKVKTFLQIFFLDALLASAYARSFFFVVLKCLAVIQIWITK